MHFTLGPIKPWHWFAPWVSDEFATWQTMRAGLAAQDAAQVCQPRQHSAECRGVVERLAMPEWQRCQACGSASTAKQRQQTSQ